MKVGDRFIIGNKEANRHYYSLVIGMEGYVSLIKDGSILVTIDDKRFKQEASSWYIKEVDLLPIATNNKEAVKLLRR